MPLTMANIGEVNEIKRIGGNEETRRFLANLGFVAGAGFIYLTDSGKEIANMIYERHEFISKWLIELGVPEEIATDDACQMEHVISRESFNAIKEYVRTH